MARTDTREAWRRLRARRWSPPGAASDGPRCRTFVATLHQVEQLFRAGARTEPATRVMHLHWALGQAGRAMAAAAMDCGESDWRLPTGGVAITGLRADLPDVTVYTDPPGSTSTFVKISNLLNSPVWGECPIRLEAIWDSLPVNLGNPLTTGLRNVPVATSPSGARAVDRLLATAPDTEPGPNQGADHVYAAHDDVGAAQGLYPRTVTHGHTGHGEQRRLNPRASAGRGSGGGQQPDSGTPDRTHTGRPARWRMKPPPDRPVDLRGPRTVNPTGPRRTIPFHPNVRSYAGETYRFPVIEPLSCELHSLMAWWAVLYALARLAEVEPARWSAQNSYVGGRHAQAIEHLLDQAVSHLPVLIADGIDDVSAY